MVVLKTLHGFAVSGGWIFRGLSVAVGCSRDVRWMAAGRLVGWLIGWLVGGLGGWLVGWFVGWLVD